MRLRIAGEVPADAFARPTVFTVRWNGAVLAQFTADERKVQREFLLPVEQQRGGAWSEVRLQADQTVTPQQKNPRSQDTRPLGFMLTDCVWEEDTPVTTRPAKPANR